MQILNKLKKKQEITCMPSGSKLSQIHSLMFFITGLQMVVIWHSSSSPNAFTWPIICKWKLHLKASTPGSIRSRFGLALSRQLSGLRLEDYTCIPNYSFEWKKISTETLLLAQASTHIYLQAWAWSTYMNVKCVNWTHKGYGTYSGKFTLRKSVVLVVVSKVWWMSLPLGYHSACIFVYEVSFN